MLSLGANAIIARQCQQVEKTSAGCREILKVRDKADVQGVHCITEDEDFRTVCLNTAVVETAIYQFIEEEEFLDDTPTFE